MMCRRPEGERSTSAARRAFRDDVPLETATQNKGSLFQKEGILRPTEKDEGGKGKENEQEVD